MVINIHIWYAIIGAIFLILFIVVLIVKISTIIQKFGFQTLSAILSKLFGKLRHII